MPTYMLQRLKADNRVVGMQVGPALVVYDAGDPRAAVEVTEADYHTVAQTGLQYSGGGPHKWEHDGTTLTSVPDTRPVVAFTGGALTLVNGEQTLEDDQNAGGNPPKIPITVTLYQADGVTLWPINSAQYMDALINGVQRRIKLSFSNGVATLQVPTATGLHGEVRTNKNFRTLEPLVVDIAAIDLV